MAELPPTLPLALAGLPPKLPELQEAEVKADSSGVKGLALTVYQKPVPMPRPQSTYRKGHQTIYSVKKTQKGPFNIEVERLLAASKWSSKAPVFSKYSDLHVAVTYQIRRPNHHYKGAKRDCGVVKEKHKKERVTGGDIDNLLKYTLDSMNKTVYDDDK